MARKGSRHAWLVMPVVMVMMVMAVMVIAHCGVVVDIGSSYGNGARAKEREQRSQQK